MIDISKEETSEVAKPDGAITEEEKKEKPGTSIKDSKVSDKSAKKSSLKSKEESKLKQKMKEMDENEAKSSMKKEISDSKKPLKEGDIQASSVMREHSAKMTKPDVPPSEKKKVTTESKKSKAALSGVKSKTETKEEKTALA